MNCSLYIHIPYCISKCDYCDFFSIGCGKACVPDDYVDALCNEIKYKIENYSITEWETVYIGGGTPSLLSYSQLKKIFDYIYLTGQKQISECTIEVNPDDVTRELIETYNTLSITRLSCGIQSLQNNVLKQVHRRSSGEQVINALNIINQYWKGDFSVDLISGLPEQTKDDFLQNLKTLMNYKIHHISMYALTIEEGTPLDNKINSGKIHYDFDKADELWIEGRNFLEKNGFNQYEVSNFCKNDKFCKHNLVYWSLQNYIGCGCGATGTIYYTNKKSIRITNIPELNKYISVWNRDTHNDIEQTQQIEEIDTKTEEFEFLMMGLRTLKGINATEYKKRFQIELSQNVIKLFEKWEKEGKAQISINSDKSVQYSLTKTGILYLNKFLLEIM